MEKRSWSLGLLGLALAGCSSYAEGAFHARGPAAWDLTPNTCTSGLHRGVVAADVYRRDPREDTEVVVMDGAEQGFLVLVRVPQTNRMVRLTASDCKLFEPRLAFNGARVNGVPGIMGSVRLDCEVPELGHVTGAAAFNCY